MYHYKLCGLSTVHLKNGYTTHSHPKYGEGVSIQDIKGLHKAIGKAIILSPGSLSAEEIKFLRKEMAMSQVMFSQALKVKEITVRKWESGGNVISGPADRLLRLLYKDYIQKNSSVRDLIDKINAAERGLLENADRLDFSYTDHWTNAA